MTAMATLRDILNDTAANAVDVEFNFNTIEAYIGSSVIKTDGTNAMTAALSLVAGDPVSSNHAASKAYVDAVLPTGIMLDYAGTVAPSANWLVCDGTIVSRVTYAALFALVGTTFNTGGEGGTQFRLPDLRRKVAVGYDSTGGTGFNAIGATGGSADAVLPSHTHTGPSHTHTGPSHTHTGPSHTHTFTTGTDSADHYHSTANTSQSLLFRSIGTGSVGLSTIAGSDTLTWAAANGQATGTVSNFHTHSGTTAADGTGATGASGTGATSADGTGATGSAGVPATNQNYSPYVILTKIIKV